MRKAVVSHRTCHMPRSCHVIWRKELQQAPSKPSSLCLLPIHERQHKSSKTWSGLATTTKNCRTPRQKRLPHRLMGVVGVYGLSSLKNMGSLQVAGLVAAGLLICPPSEECLPIPKPHRQFLESHRRASSKTLTEIITNCDALQATRQHHFVEAS